MFLTASGEEDVTDLSSVSSPHNGGHGRINGDEGQPFVVVTIR